MASAPDPLHSTSRRCAWLAYAAFALLGCTRDPISPDDEGPFVDAERYARGLCAQRCYRLDECDLQGAEDREQCKVECTDDALTTLESDPCWEAQLELRRCIMVEATCEFVADEDLPVAGTRCEARELDLRMCDRT
jgi:hypothetical protein